MSEFIKRTGLFLQARLNSKRMPGKSLMNICGKPLIAQCMERLNVVPSDCKVVLTTKDCEAYFKPIALSLGWEIFIGEEQNVLKRFVDAANYFKVNTIIRATADNPLLSSEIASETLDLFNKGNCDLAYLKPIPYGSGVEVVSLNALNIALQKTKIPYHLEHVTPYIYEHKDKFKIKEGYFNDEEVHRSDIRLTVDTRDDYEKINHLFRELNKKNQNMKIRSVISTFDNIKFIKHRRILFITAFSDSYGMGHLNRINMLAEKLKKEFSIFFSFKYGDKNKLKELKKSEYNYLDYDKLSEHVESLGVFDRVIVDLRDTTLNEMKQYKSLGCVISIDDMGQGGKISDVNINTLPIINKGKEKQNFNFNGLEYLITPVKKDKENTKLNNPPKSILISFGGSDPSSFTQPIADILAKSGYKITVIEGPYFNKTINETENCKIIKNVYQLDNYIKSSDIIITSFGMTFLEALILEKPVILINHTDYHDELTENFRYPYYIKRDEDLLNDLNDTKEQFETALNSMILKMIEEKVFNKNNEESKIKSFFNMKIGSKINEIINFIKKWNPVINICPNCSKIHDNVLYRTEKYNMVKCNKCGLIYLINFNENSNIYEKEYFLEEYENTYGKTYEQDKNNIVELAKNRLEIIKTYLQTGTLLDFGSGLGFFSEYAENNNFKTLSIDISKYATDYIKNKLKLNSVKGNEEYLEKNDTQFDIITSFYVIEHINDFKKLLFLFTCHLKKFGVLSLATPNSDGITFKTNFNNYVKKHPEDHNYIFSPKFLKNILKESGYINIKINVTGIHPDRFTKFEKLINNKYLNKYITKFIYFYARLFKLGDTFEIYAQKK